MSVHKNKRTLEYTPPKESPLGTITLGEYTIGPSYANNPKKISITHSSGEAGDFDREEIIELVAKFYGENF